MTVEQGEIKCTGWGWGGLPNGVIMHETRAVVMAWCGRKRDAVWRRQIGTVFLARNLATVNPPGHYVPTSGIILDLEGSPSAGARSSGARSGGEEVDVAHTLGKERGPGKVV